MFRGPDDPVVEEESGAPLILAGPMLARSREVIDEVVDDAARAALKVRGGPPAALDQERAVLSGILLDARTLKDATDVGLTAAHFFRAAHATVFRAFLALRDAGEPIGVLTVVEHLKAGGQLDAVGGAAAITQLECLMQGSAHVGAYAGHLVDYAVRREVLSAAQEAARAAIAGTERPEQIIRFAEHHLVRARSSAQARSPWRAELARAHDDLRAAGVRQRAWERPIGKSALDLAESDLPPPSWVVQGMLRERSVVVLGGAPKGGKTWDEAELAISVASGTPAFGEFACKDPGPVLMICLEDDERDLRTRLRALAVGRRMPLQRALGRIHYEARGALDLCRDEDCAGIVASARMLPEPLRLLCIDPLRDANSGEENSNDDMRAVMHRVRAIRDVLGCAVMLVHHLSKPGAETKGAAQGSIFDRFRGAGALRGAWDAGIGKDTRQRSPTCIKSRMEVETRGGRGAGVFALQLDITDDDHGNARCAGYAFYRDPADLFGTPTEATKEPTTQGERRDGAKGRLLALLTRELRRDLARGVEPQAWSSAYLAGQVGISKSGVHRYLSELEAEGSVIGTPRGFRATDPVEDQHQE